MAAYAEGLNILRNVNVGTLARSIDPETTPVRDPVFYQFGMNLPEIAEV
jgi:6-phosphogluconate dehydrogenase